ncbi:hypothetical protein HNP55_002344 [Paucibacter oligotrophus]|uniref:Secreted protein with PEP-CTERM sorting signal n=1 Tax=Roseateles oligotrophus TaxID=1769250 RepID=A0A840L7T4_9BURK|nr:hypothetical protein [Roseateles oligotrophus]MBB4843821.1 hypothetical protein [Roseateles oligotrophus]
MSPFVRLPALLAAIFVALVSPVTQATPGDSLSYSFNTASTGGATPTTSQATLRLTETALGVDFLLTPNWGSSSAHSVTQLQFAYSGGPLSYVDGAGPNASFTLGSGHIDSSYSVTSMVSMHWPSSGSQKFDTADPFTAWSFNGAGVSLANFMVYATSSAKPSPAFGVISMPGATPSNWVALEAPLSPAPEPQTALLLLGGLGLLARLGRSGTRS